MNKRMRVFLIAIVGMVSLLIGLSTLTSPVDATRSQMKQVESKGKNNHNRKDQINETLGKVNWQGTKVYDANQNDLTAENAGFIGLAKYDAKTGRYEFFDKQTGKTRGDSGIYFVTNDGTKRILISQTKNYQAIVDLVEVTAKKFTYKRIGKDKAGNDVEVFVEHVPYKGKKLAFTTQELSYKTKTGKIETKESGAKLLSKTLWHGTVVLDEKGNNVTAYNKNYISLAKFDEATNKYEFFNEGTGVSRGDYGYYDVLYKNKLRVHASIGANKYGAVLELTELNQQKFTYKRMGKDKAGQDIAIFVEHEPYTGTIQPAFSF